MGKLKNTLRWLLYVPPIYVTDRPSAASVVEGWRFAYEQEKERRIAAEKALTEMLPEVTDEERHELARLLAKVDYDDWCARSPNSPVKYFALKDADRLIAAGYRKLR